MPKVTLNCQGNLKGHGPEQSYTFLETTAHFLHRIPNIVKALGGKNRDWGQKGTWTGTGLAANVIRQKPGRD